MDNQQEYYGFIYEWTDSTNGKNYIGSHKGTIDDDYIGSGKHFISAYKKRLDAFTRKILEYVFEDDRKILIEAEQKYLDLIDWKNTYNISRRAGGGDISGIHSRAYGKPKSAGHKQLLSERCGRSGEENGMYGKKHSIESLDLIAKGVSKALKGTTQSESHINLRIYNTTKTYYKNNENIVLKIWKLFDENKTIREISQELKISTKRIKKNIKNRNKIKEMLGK